MIYLLHGDNQPKLREEFLRLKNNYTEFRYYERDLSELPAYLSSPSFFGRRELVALENPDLGEFARLLPKLNVPTHDLVLLFPKRLREDEVAKIKGAKVLVFWEEVPKNVFPFLDALFAREKKKALFEAHRLLKEGTDLDFILKMIGWQLRNLVRVRENAVAGMAPYLVKKVRRFTGSWGEEDLKRGFTLLFREDRRLKKGKKAPLDFLINQLIRDR